MHDIAGGPRARPFGGNWVTRMFRLIILPALALALSGCASMMNSATERLADNLSAGVMQQDDLQTVHDGGPAYLLMIDGLINGDPDNEALLRAGARLYSAYASAFVQDSERARRLAGRARDYGERAVCARGMAICGADEGEFDAFKVALAQTGEDDVPALYDYAAAWAGWVEVSRSDWNAIADLPKITAAMERVLALNESYEDGAAHLYLGVLDTLRPAALGGEPEQGRAHFERADELAGGRNLMVKVLYARNYARLVFDRELHDRLLRAVLAADPQQGDYTLINTLAQEQARQLLASADEYF
jgi:hypothetical protein